MYEWNSKKVLITGATGFLGSWLTESLVEKGADVKVMVRGGSPRAKCIQHLLSKIGVVKGDIRNREAFDSAIKEQDVIFHLAAITQVLYSIKNPSETIDVNLNGTLNVLESMRVKDQGTFLVYMSTDKVYGEPSRLPIEVDDSLNAKSPYDASKLAADRACYSYHKTYGLRASIARCSNIYGGREANELRVVPDFVRALLRKEPPIIRGSGRHERDFIYIDDIVRGLILVAENPEKTNGEAFNFGTEKPVSINDLSKMIIRLSDQDIEPKVLGKSTPGEIDKQYLSYSKVKDILSWLPKVNLEEGLRRTIDWYRKNPWFEDVISKTSGYYGIKALN